MSMIKILCKTMILLVCSIIQVFSVLLEGASSIFAKLGGYLDILSEKLMRRFRDEKFRANIDIPL